MNEEAFEITEKRLQKIKRKRKDFGEEREREKKETKRTIIKQLKVTNI